MTTSAANRHLQAEQHSQQQEGAGRTTTRVPRSSGRPVVPRSESRTTGKGRRRSRATCVEACTGGRSGRGGLGQMPSRHPHPGQSVSPVASGPNNIPTGPRSASISSASGPSPVNSKTFNPPTGPSCTAAAPSRPRLAQSLMNTMTPVVPGGRLEPPLSTWTSANEKEEEQEEKKEEEKEEKKEEEEEEEKEKMKEEELMDR
ncbi:hypothetical protein CONLIGDRAFT_685762 [Coniochaeta ligniaria NRRL 30616]|uniref:Uncharacterized protein n=1 Tax=Coniochaeta ligniaria NRRL 30616 TaxID=1408157 RepID=A0A1J7ISQ9_9PEZI|nr:hypothetical protein CONLIGDRAFT_685762 [Coniochaeta ligniaria NRRL 30616]